MLHLQHIARKIIDVALQRATERLGGALVGAWCPSQAKIDAARIERLQRAELFRDDQWSMVRQHDAAGADPDL